MSFSVIGTFHFSFWGMKTLLNEKDILTFSRGLQYPLITLFLLVIS